VFSAVDEKPKSTYELQRLSNLRAHPAAALLVDHYDEDWSKLWWVRIDGTGGVVERGSEYDRGLEVLVAKYRHYRQRRPRGAVVVLDIRTWKAWP
jgi:PPOX class probable F420-dependent enzyme